MGKYPDSKLLTKYSDWHWNKCARRTYLTDQDVGIVYQPFIYRLWVELREIENEISPVAVLDVKSFRELNKQLTKCSTVWYEWVIKTGLPVYLVYMDDKFANFLVKQYPDGNLIQMSEVDYVKFLDNLTIRK